MSTLAARRVEDRHLDAASYWLVESSDPRRHRQCIVTVSTPYLIAPGYRNDNIKASLPITRAHIFFCVGNGFERRRGCLTILEPMFRERLMERAPETSLLPSYST